MSAMDAMHNGSGQTAQREQTELSEQEALGHILPNWFQRFQDWAFLPLMIIAEMFINGFMMASGLVGDQNNPFAGGWGHWINEATWVALFLAGAVMGGMALRTSAAAAYWSARSFWRTFWNIVGLLGFVSLEVWASVMQRSYNPITSPADQAVLARAGFAHPSVTITDVVVALALPLAAMFWGFSTMKPAHKSAAEVRAEGERRVAQAEVNAQVREAQVRGLLKTAAATGVADLARRMTGEHAPDQQSVTGTSGSASSSDGGPDDDGSDPGSSLSRGVTPRWSESELAGGLGSSSPITLAQKRAMLNSASATKRVAETGVVGVNDLTELLACSPSQAGTILRHSGIAHRLSESRTAPSVASAAQLTAWLVRHDSPAYREHGRKLESALKLGNRGARRRRSGDLLADGTANRFSLESETDPRLAVVGFSARRGASARSAGQTAAQANVIPFTSDRTDHRTDRGTR